MAGSLCLAEMIGQLGCGTDRPRRMYTPTMNMEGEEERGREGGLREREREKGEKERGREGRRKREEVHKPVNLLPLHRQVCQHSGLPS